MTTLRLSMDNAHTLGRRPGRASLSFALRWDCPEAVSIRDHWARREIQRLRVHFGGHNWEGTVYDASEVPTRIDGRYDLEMSVIVLLDPGPPATACNPPP